MELTATMAECSFDSVAMDNWVALIVAVEQSSKYYSYFEIIH